MTIKRRRGLKGEAGRDLESSAVAVVKPAQKAASKPATLINTRFQIIPLTIGTLQRMIVCGGPHHKD